MKTLIIAEKPSVAADIARALGVKKQGDIFEGDDYVISSAIGHLVELFMPDEIDKKWKAWRLATLPILPETFQLKPIEKTKDRFQALKKLMARKDVGQVINACDAGREGELIFTYIYELAGCKKPVQRLWMVSMTQQAIRSSFKDLRDGRSMVPLQEAARSRSEADWLIGINGTRAFTSRMYGIRGKQVASVGRVQTPTLAMMVEREQEIRNFVPRAFWRLVGTFALEAGSYEGVYQKPGFKKSHATEEEGEDRADRIWDEAEARRVLAAAEAAGWAAVTDERKRSRQGAPRLYDLTTLQREANNRYGLPAAKTLRIAQALYEKHKMITYPRTDSRALPEDYGNQVIATLRALDGSLEPYADRVLKEKWVDPKNRKIFNNAQVSDHFAIIPTEVTGHKLAADEAKVYDMVARRFVAAFYPNAEYDVTTRLSRAAGHEFKTEGRILVVPGWLEVYGKLENEESGKDLPPLYPTDFANASRLSGPEAHLAATLTASAAPAPASARASSRDTSPVAGAEITALDLKSEATRPPARYTEATLLAAMEGAGKLVDDEELAEAMKEKGLGTPATRAAIIDTLLFQKYIDREGRDLVPTPKAEDLIRFIAAVDAEDLTRPDMTGNWEFKLRQVERGELSREAFMDGIRAMTSRIVERTRGFEESDTSKPVPSLLSPTDGQPMMETLRSFKSQDGALTIYKTIGNRRLQEEELQTLLRDGKVGPLDQFKAKSGKAYSALLRLQDNKVVMDFGNGGSSSGGGGDNGGAGGEPVDLTQFPVIGTDPLSGTPVYATPSAFISEAHQQGNNQAFRMSRTMLGKTLPEPDIAKLLSERRTGVIAGFRSKKNNRLFSAILLLKEDGRIGFEFPPRAPAKKKGASPRTRSGASATQEAPTAEPSSEAPEPSGDEPF